MSHVPPSESSAAVENFCKVFARVRDEMGHMMVGQREIVEGVLAAFFAGGHVLLEGVPGLGKTMLVRTLGEAVNLKFARIQFTPDLMPSDIVGTNIIVEDEQGKRALEGFMPSHAQHSYLDVDALSIRVPWPLTAVTEGTEVPFFDPRR